MAAISRIWEQLRYSVYFTQFKTILIKSDTSSNFVHSGFNQEIYFSQYDIQRVAFDPFPFASDTCYSSHLELPSGSDRNTPDPVSGDNWDHIGINLSAPQPESDSTTAPQAYPSLLGPLETISQASSSESNPRKPKSPDLGGATHPLKADVPVITWPSSGSSGRSRTTDLDENRPRRGRRKGFLSPVKRIKISKTRRIGACMFCAVAKVEVLSILLFIANLANKNYSVLAIRMAYARVAKESTNAHDCFQNLRYALEHGFQITLKSFFLVGF